MESPRCWLCGGPALEHRVGATWDPVSSASFHVAWCSKCELGHTHPRPADPSASYGAEYHGGRHGSTEQMALRRRLRILQKAADGVTPRVLVDVGCGDGTFLRGAAGRGWQVCGTEMATDRARRLGYRVERDLTDLADMAPIGAATFWHSLEHMADPLGTLRQVEALMAPGGVVVVAVPNFAGLQARMGGAHWLHLDLPRHLSHFGPTSLERTLRAANFEPNMRWDQELEYDVMGWSQTLLSMAQPGRTRVFFDWASGRPVQISPARLAANAAAGALLSAAALPVVPVLAKLGRGSTIVMSARKPSEPDRWS